jgi:hypothetical protein
MDPSTRKQVFLGGACGRSNWRRTIAIPALDTAGVTWYDPQLGLGEWTPAREETEMRAKAEADVLLFVINAETRGIASIGEVAYFLGSRRPLALSVTDVGQSDRIDGELLSGPERDDLNRGRIFVRSMAQQEGVPVFGDVEGAVGHAIRLCRVEKDPVDAGRLRGILAGIGFRDGGFLVEEIDGGFLIQLRCDEVDVGSGARETYFGRKWYIGSSASESDIVRTAFKAAVTWQEHETREGFTYQGVPVFGAHCDVRDLAQLITGKPRLQR